MPERYTKYWINVEKPNPIFVSEKQIEDYVKMFPRGTKVLIQQVVFNCCDKGHTFRQIMGYEDFDCE